MNAARMSRLTRKVEKLVEKHGPLDDDQVYALLRARHCNYSKREVEEFSRELRRHHFQKWSRTHGGWQTVEPYFRQQLEAKGCEPERVDVALAAAKKALEEGRDFTEEDIAEERQRRAELN